jgi:hypothetical protein
MATMEDLFAAKPLGTVVDSGALAFLFGVKNNAGNIDTPQMTASGELPTHDAANLSVLGAIGTLLSGQATAALQGTAITALNSIIAKLSNDPATQTTLAAILVKLADPATQTTLAAVLAKLSSDPATQTTLAAVLAKLSSDPATATLQGTANTSLATIAGKDFATQTTLATLASQTTAAAILAKLSADPATQTTLAAVLTALQAALPAGANLIGGVRIDKAAGTDLNSTVAAYGLLPVGGWKLKSSVAVTTTAVTYTTGQVIGGMLTLPNITPLNDEAYILQEVSVNCKSAQTTALDVIFFSALPSGASAITNASALVIAAADYALVTEVVHITDWTAGNPSSFAQAGGLAKLKSPTSGTTSAYACIVARGSLTAGTTSELTLNAKTANV